MKIINERERQDNKDRKKRWKKEIKEERGGAR